MKNVRIDISDGMEWISKPFDVSGGTIALLQRHAWQVVLQIAGTESDLTTMS